MFNNIGGKIKALAQVICILGILLSVIIGLVFMAMDEDLVLIGLVIMIVGSLFSWIGSFMTYGFGQLIENSDIIAKNSGGNIRNAAKSETKEQKIATLNKWFEQGLITKEEYIEKARELQ